MGLAEERKFVVFHTPRSVPIITSSVSKGFCKIAQTGRSGRFPSFGAHDDPPSDE